MVPRYYQLEYLNMLNLWVGHTQEGVLNEGKRLDIGITEYDSGVNLPHNTDIERLQSTTGTLCAKHRSAPIQSLTKCVEPVDRKMDEWRLVSR